MIYRLGTPALDHSVMAVALMLWFVYILERPAALLIFFIMFARVLTPSGLCSNFRTEICLRILKESTTIRVDLFKIELQSLVAIVLVFRFVDSCFFLVTGFVIDTTSIVFGRFIVGHGCKLSPGCFNSEVEAFSGQNSLSFGAASAKEKNDMKPHIL